MSNMYEDLKSGGYIYKGLVTNVPGEPCDNAFLFSAMAYWIARANNDFSCGEPFREIFYGFVCIPPMRRFPGDRGFCSHDENIGLASMWSMAAIYLCQYPQHKRFFYLPAFFRLMARLDVKWYQRLSWNLWAWITGLSEKQNTSSKCLFYLMSLATGWRLPKSITKKYSGPKEMLGIYYGNHPIVWHAKGSW